MVKGPKLPPPSARGVVDLAKRCSEEVGILGLRFAPIPLSRYIANCQLPFCSSVSYRTVARCAGTAFDEVVYESYVSGFSVRVDSVLHWIL